MTSAVLDVGTVVESAPLLTAADRCDRCAAPARVRVIFPLVRDGAQLLFCSHHYNAHSVALELSNAIVDDQRQRLPI